MKDENPPALTRSPPLPRGGRGDRSLVILPPSALSNRPPLFAISVISAAALGYEILLMRLFSIVQWHHFAYMIISFALLGYGASGTFIAIQRHRLAGAYEQAFIGSATLFGLSAVTCFVVAQRVPFNPLEILWDPRQPYYLLLIYGLLFVPFFFAASCICLTMTRFSDQVHRIYSADILGAGAGSLGIVLLLFATFPIRALTFAGSLALVAATLACFELRVRARWLPGLLLAGAAVLTFAPPESFSTLRLSPYKDLSQALRVKGARLMEERSSPLGLLSVVESPEIPFRHAPGLSLNAPAGPPPQLGIFTDGDGLMALTRYDGRRESLAYLDYLTSAVPYHLAAEPARVLVLGAGAGADVLQAIYHGAGSIDAVELNSQVVDLVGRRFADYSGNLYSTARVQAVEARGFVAASGNRYDLIQLALLDSFSVSSAGLHALMESYLYTVEAMQDYLRHLNANGLLAITRWVNLPPRDALKLFVTAVVALERSGVTDAGLRLALIRSWKTATLLVKNGEFTARDITALKEFCRTRSFDLEYYPGIREGEANRYNILDEPYFFRGASALLGAEREAFLDRYKFDISPATDDRPYFFRFFKWRSLPELLSLKQQGGLPLIEWGYPVLVATLAQAVAAGLLLIVLPLWISTSRDHAAESAGPSRLRIAVYFLAIGLAFMFVEIAFIQKFILFLSHPLYAVAVVLCAFLVFAGIGSRYSDPMTQRSKEARVTPIARVAGAIALAAIIYLFLLPEVFRSLMGLADALKILISVALIAPLAFFMGMPFPLGLARVAARAAGAIPWAWAINACASVVGAVLATLLAVHFGFMMVIILALLLYGMAAASFPKA